MKFNQTWLQTGMRTQFDTPHRSAASIFPVSFCLDRGSHSSHIYKGNYCPGHRFDYT